MRKNDFQSILFNSSSLKIEVNGDTKDVLLFQKTFTFDELHKISAVFRLYDSINQIVNKLNYKVKSFNYEYNNH